jgi:hypothetical protein
MNLRLNQVGYELDRLWLAESNGGHGLHSALFTLVAVVDDATLQDQACGTLREVMRIHPCRTMLATWSPGATPALEAQVELVRDQASDGRALGEWIHLHGRGKGRDWLPENLDRLTLPDLPLCLWWVGDLPDADTLYERLIGLANVVIVDSSQMHLRDLEKVARLLRGPRPYALADLTWIRMRAIQDLVARFFDEQPLRPFLANIERMELCHTSNAGDMDVASSEAALFLGWFAAALRLPTEAPQWETTADALRVELPYPSGPGRLSVTFRREDLPGLPSGHLTGIKMEGANCSFRVERHRERPHRFRCAAFVQGDLRSSFEMAIEPQSESYYLARYLENPSKNQLLEASIRAASNIVHPMAPRYSSLPPSHLRVY